jgi:hypothetical protein
MKSFFVLVAVVVCLFSAGANARAQSQNAPGDPPRYEVGIHFSSLTLTPSDLYRTEAGFGGRFTANLNGHVALEAETTYFPNRGRSGESRAAGRAVQGLFGVKAGKRWERFGLFAKARPGFVSFSEGKLAPDPNFVTNGVFGLRTERATHFAVDAGAVLELYVSRRWAARFDFGDTVIRYRGQTLQTNAPPPFPTTIILLDNTRHNFQFNAGIGFRFD